jgi:hypothetical protein
MQLNNYLHVINFNLRRAFVGYLRILIENSLVSKAGSKAVILTGSP